jgi:hypothetical protein
MDNASLIERRETSYYKLILSTVEWRVDCFAAVGDDPLVRVDRSCLNSTLCWTLRSDGTRDPDRPPPHFQLIGATPSRAPTNSRGMYESINVRSSYRRRDGAQRHGSGFGIYLLLRSGDFRPMLFLRGAMLVPTGNGRISAGGR